MSDLCNTVLSFSVRLAMTGQYLLFSVVALPCLYDIQPVSRQALFTLLSDEECYSGASVVCLYS